jgi:hypothetical protein
MAFNVGCWRSRSFGVSQCLSAPSNGNLQMFARIAAGLRRILTLFVVLSSPSQRPSVEFSLLDSSRPPSTPLSASSMVAVSRFSVGRCWCLSVEGFGMGIVYTPLHQPLGLAEFCCSGPLCRFMNCSLLSVPITQSVYPIQMSS